LQEITLKTACFIILCIFLLTGCGQPEKKKVVIKKNQFYRCEDSGRIEKKMVNLINTARSSGRRCGGKKYTATVVRTQMRRQKIYRDPARSLESGSGECRPGALKGHGPQRPSQS
jgi:hypothetical protein